MKEIEEILKNEFEIEKGYSHNCNNSALYEYIEWLENKVYKDQSKEVDVDFYSGKLNELRIKTYERIGELYNVSNSSIRDIFNMGIDFTIKNTPKLIVSDKDIEKWANNIPKFNSTRIEARVEGAKWMRKELTNKEKI